MAATTAEFFGNDVGNTGGISRYTCASDGVTNGTDGCIRNNPLFVDAENDDFRLRADSACINNGGNTYVTSGTDLMGNLRIIDEAVDMGAYESPSVSAYAITTSFGAHGMMEPTAPEVFAGYNQRFSVQPQSGYHIDSLIVDGVPVSPVSSYTFTNVQAAHSISVTFAMNPTTFYVDASQMDDSGEGTSWSAAKKSIQSAIDLGVTAIESGLSGITVWVTNGTYNTGGATAPYTLTNRVCILREITVQSVNGPDVTVIEGAPDPLTSNGFAAVRCVYLTTNAVLSGFTLANGHTSGPEYAGLGANSGGGALCYLGGTLNNCIIRANSAYSCGGGVSLYEGGLINNCVIKDNVAGNGGGIYFSLGGGIANNCTVVGNSASAGAGVTLDFDYGGTLNNCIVWANISSSPGWPDDVHSPGNYTANYTCADPLLEGLGNTSADPLFVDLVGGNLHLQSNSPCINAGNNAYSTGAFDLDGNPRIFDDAVDQGAYESGYTAMIPQFITEFLPASGSVLVLTNTVCLSAQGCDSGIPVTFTNLPGSPVVWVNSTTMQFSALGDVYITANQTGSSHYYPATAVTNHYTLRAGTIYANAERPDDSGDGLSWATAKKTIQAAVELTADGDTVWVTNGTYNTGGVVAVAPEIPSGMEPGVVTNRVCITRSITVKSVNGPQVTIVDGQGSCRGFYCGAQNIVIDGFTITNGYSDTHGGGVMTEPFPWCMLNNCLIGGNTAVGNGGGAWGGTLNNCLLIGNFCGGSGGGLFGGSMNGCAVIDNTAGGNGGGAHIAGVLTIFSGVLQNCSLIGNSAVAGGGVYRSNGGTLNNCIVWGNVGGNIYDENTFFYFPPFTSPSTVNYTCSDPLPEGAGNICANPLFVDAANSNFQLQTGSPCINAGNNSYVSTAKDLNGNSRIVASVVDMGAYEFFGLPGDFDCNGLLDEWEVRHFGKIGRAVSTAICSNGVNTILQAYIAGLDPNDASAFFEMDGNRTAEKSVLRWNATSGRVYSVYFSTNLLNGFQPLATNIPWTAGCYTDSVHNAQSQGYYKIDVKLDD
jgi:hypothetical protein